MAVIQYLPVKFKQGLINNEIAGKGGGGLNEIVEFHSVKLMKAFQGNKRKQKEHKIH